MMEEEKKGEGGIGKYLVFFRLTNSTLDSHMIDAFYGR